MMKSGMSFLKTNNCCEAVIFISVLKFPAEDVIIF